MNDIPISGNDESVSAAPQPPQAPASRGKRFWRSKWTRRSLQTAAVLATLTALGYTGIDLWAAAQKKLQLKELGIQGIALDQALATDPFPPADQNFGALQLFQDLKLENPPAESTLDAFWMTERVAVRLPKWLQPFDPAELEKYLPSADTPQARWEMFESHNREILATLRQGMSRRDAISLRRIDPGNDPLAIYTMSARDMMRVARFGTWLSCRAYLAMDAGRPADAMESLLILERLAEVEGSDETLVGKLIALQLDEKIYLPLARGIQTGTWDAAQLSRMEQALAQRPDRMAGWRRAMLMDARGAVILLNHLKDHPELWNTGIIPAGSEASRKMARLMPDGVLDMAQVRTLETLARTLPAMTQNTPLQQWQLGESLNTNSGAHTVGILDLLQESFDVGARCVLTCRVKTEVLRAQARIACRVGIYHAQHGAWPAILHDAGCTDDPALLDPFSGKPFGYRVEEPGFAIYSVGPDGIDDGGKRPHDHQKKPDEGSDWVW
jgi:hypothetical protein